MTPEEQLEVIKELQIKQSNVLSKWAPTVLSLIGIGAMWFNVARWSARIEANDFVQSESIRKLQGDIERTVPRLEWQQTLDARNRELSDLKAAITSMSNKLDKFLELRIRP